MLEAGTDFETEFRLVHPDGAVRWVRERARVQPGSGDRPRRMVGVTQDVTEQVETRRAAERAEEKWSTVVDLAPTGIAVSEVETGRFLVINEAAAELLGYTPEEATERSALEVDAGVSPDRRRELIREVRERQGVRNKTLELRSRNGETRHVRWSARLLEWEGREFLFQTVQDVTEERRRREALRRSEERYRSLFDDCPDPIVITTTGGEFVRVNDAFLEVTGYGRDDLERLEANDLYVYPERREELLDRLKETGHVTDFEVELENRTGDRRILEFTSTLQRAPDGDRRLVRAIGRDVTGERRQRKQIRRSEARYRTLFELSNDAIFVFDPDGHIREVNEKAAELTGRDSAELEGMSVLDLHPEGGRAAAESALERTVAEGGGRFDLPFRREGGDDWVGEVSTSRIELPDRAFVQAVVRDVTEPVEARRELARAKEKFQGIFDISPVALAIQAPETRRFLEVNRAFESLLGYEETDVLSRRGIPELWDDPDRRDEILGRVQAGETVRNEEVAFRREDGTPVHLLMSMTEREIAGERYLIGAAQDITERRKMEDQLEEMAYRDPLTGLANRRLLRDQADRDFSLAERRDRFVGCAYIDLDRFKQVNDRFGHEAGDDVLREVARRLREQIREADLAARVGGDEFVVLLPDLDDPGEVLTAARRITSCFEAPVPLEEGRAVSIDVSVGVAAFPVDGTELDELLRRSDRALRRAKERGGRIARYYQETDVHVPEASEIDRAIRTGLEAGDFELHYQPVLRLSDRTLESVEALVRWHHPERGLLEAGEFVPHAERSGTICAIDRWGVERAVRQLASWQEGGDGPDAVSVNLSALSFRNPGMTRRISTLVEEAGLPDRSGLIVEVTESEAMEDPEVTMELLHGIREAGVRVALDDFGTGHSSLGYLDRFPVDRLKLDRRFVGKISDEMDEGRLLRGMIDLAGRLELLTTGEGIETRAQLEWLSSAGCDLGQGFLIGRPVPLEEIEDSCS